MSLVSPFLYKGIILAILKSLITLPVERERFIICESAMIILLGEDFSNLSGISSKPALSFGLLFISCSDVKKFFEILLFPQILVFEILESF